MTLWAARSGVTTLDESFINALLAAQPSVLIFDGSKFHWNEGSGLYENDISQASFALLFGKNSSSDGPNTIGRIELDIKKYGVGADLTLEIRDQTFNPDGSNEGRILKAIKYPAKLFSSSGGYISLPVDISDLDVNAVYWLVLKRAGDSVNRLVWMGETVQSVYHPTYSRSGDSGAWTDTGMTPHFRIFTNTPGTYQLRHGIYGGNAKTTLNYDGNGNITEIWRWLPAADGTFLIVDCMTPVYDVNGVPVRWNIS